MNKLTKSFCPFFNSVRLSSGQMGDLGSGAGLGGGGGGAIRSAGGSFGRMEAGKEEEFFYKQQMQQLADLKSGLGKEIPVQEQHNKEQEAAIESQRKRQLDLDKP